MAEQLLFKQKLNVLVPQLHNSSHNSPNASASFSLIIFFVGTPPPTKEQKDACQAKKPPITASPPAFSCRSGCLWGILLGKHCPERVPALQPRGVTAVVQSSPALRVPQWGFLGFG